MPTNENLTEYNPSSEIREPTVAEKFQLPHGFVTEKGSAYTYKADGSVHRSKFDGTEHDQGIAVFLPDDDETTGNSAMLMRFHQTESGEHRERNTYIVQFEGTKDTIDYSKYRKVYNASDVTNPDMLALVLLRADSGTFDRATGVSLQPVKGAYVFEMSKLPDGKTNRHPGHRVTDIIA